MPNWTSNRIICKKELGEKLLTKTDDGYLLDFNKLIPMPKELDIESGSSGEKGLIFLYLTSPDLCKSVDIRKAYKGLNPFNKEIHNNPFFKDIDSNLSKYYNDKSFQDSIELGKKYLDNYIKYGYCNWYNWRVDNWGTKWNVDDEVSVIDYRDNEYEILFDTAWSAPFGIIKKYFDMCENGDFYWEYENEEEGFLHILKKKNNKLVEAVERYVEEYSLNKDDDYEIWNN